MKKVFKYPIIFGDYFNVMLPKYAEILTCKQINGSWFLWAMVEDDQPPIEKRKFRLCGTGHHLIEENYRWITTELEIVNETTLIWHIFEII